MVLPLSVYCIKEIFFTFLFRTGQDRRALFLTIHELFTFCGLTGNQQGNPCILGFPLLSVGSI